MGSQPKFAARRQIGDGARIIVDRRTIVDPHIAFDIQFRAQLAGDLITTDIDPGDALFEADLDDALLSEYLTAQQEDAILGRAVLFRPRSNVIGVEEDGF